MDVSGLKAHIQTNTIPNILIFSGTEWEVQKIYIQQISKVTGLETLRIDSIADVVSRFKSSSFIQTNYIYISRDDVEYMQNEKLQELVKQTIGKNIFILLITSLDKRLKFYKAYKDNIIEFEPLKPAVLKKYIQKQIDLSDKNAEKLMEVCDFDYGHILLEIDKIKHYQDYLFDKTFVLKDAIVADSVFPKLLKDGTVHTPPKDAIFDFVDAVLNGNIKCFDLYEQCKAVGEATLVIINVLYTNAKAVLQVQSCESKDIGKATGLTGWQIMNAKKHVGQYRNSELLNIMRLCTQCEQGIKTGKIEEQFAVEYILVNIL